MFLEHQIFVLEFWIMWHWRQE